MFPSVCVLSHEDFVRARKVVIDYFNAQPQASEEWQCPKCRESGRSVWRVLVLSSSPARQARKKPMELEFTAQFLDPFCGGARTG